MGVSAGWSLENGSRQIGSYGVRWQLFVRICRRICRGAVCDNLHEAAARKIP